MKFKQISNRTELQWDEIVKHVKNAFVYLDDAAAECLHWHGGLERLLKYGAISIENFSPYVKQEWTVKKAVFILMTPLCGLIWKYLMIIIKSNKFQQCTVMTSLPAKFHDSGESESEQSFIVIENRILNWIEGVNKSVNIYHIPLFSAHISPNLFIMPSFANNFSVFTSGLCEINRQKTEEMSFNVLDYEMEASIRQLAYSLHSFLDTYETKGDFFSLGSLSYLLASELENISQHQKKKFTNKSSVVIIDRLLDLAGPLSQSCETVFDKILYTIPHFKGHTFDVAINMEEFASCTNEIVFERPLLAEGCLNHKNNVYEESCLNAILYKKPRECLIDLNRNIVEAAAKEGINFDNTPILTSDVIRRKILYFKENPNLLHKFSGLAQQAVAVTQAISHTSFDDIDNTAAMERALLQFLTKSNDEVLTHIKTMILEKEEMDYKIEQNLTLLAFIYMIIDAPDEDNEKSLQDTLVREFCDDEDLSEILSLLVGSDVKDEEVVWKAVKTLFSVLKTLGSMRKRFKKYKSVFDCSRPAFPASYHPLLRQLLGDIFDEKVQDIPDLEFHSAGLKDYIKTGFSLFMNVAKPRPRDNSVIFVIVLGSVTPSEMAMIKDYATLHKEKELILGCTGVVTPCCVVKDIAKIVNNLCSNHAQSDES